MSDFINDNPNDTTGKLTRAAANPIRTATQLVPAIALVEVIDAFGGDFTTRQYSALVAVGLILTSFVQNLVEQTKGKAWLK